MMGQKPLGKRGLGSCQRRPYFGMPPIRLHFLVPPSLWKLHLPACSRQKNHHTSQHALAKGTTPLPHAGNFENHSQYPLGPKHHSKNYISQHTLDTIPKQILTPRTKLIPKNFSPQH